MCLIIHKPKNKRIPQEYIDNAKRINPHGFGVTYLDTLEGYKSLSYSKVDAMLATDRPLVAHFRYATVGKVNKQNIHPFAITNADRFQIYSNGTIDGYGSVCCSDIRMIAEKVLGQMNRNKWVPFLKQSDTRFCLVDTLTGEVVRVNKWHKVDGIWYSKDNCFNKYRVAVYGTLKQGHGNHHLLAGTRFVEAGRTKDRYPLIVDGLPYLLDEKDNGNQVRVEVYDVDRVTYKALDRLEGHPAFYKRKQIQIQLDDWSETTAWVYFLHGYRIRPDGVAQKEYYGRNVNKYWETLDEEQHEDYEMSRTDYLLQ